MSLESLHRPSSLVEQAYERILSAICTGALASGDAVRQDDLAEQLHVSRLPVLMALRQLKQQGFLEMRGRRGLQVAPIDRARFDAIYEIRSALDPLAASLAASHATRKQVARGASIIEIGRTAVASGDARATLLADVRFHEWVYEVSGNPLILQSMKTHWFHLQRSMGEVLKHRELTATLWNEHAAILNAIERGDVSEAASAAECHVTTARARVVRLLGCLDAQTGPSSSDEMRRA